MTKATPETLTDASKAFDLALEVQIRDMRSGAVIYVATTLSAILIVLGAPVGLTVGMPAFVFSIMATTRWLRFPRIIAKRSRMRAVNTCVSGPRCSACNRFKLTSDGENYDDRCVCGHINGNAQ